VTKPLLDGVVVCDLTHAYAGPLCTYQLALLGADVIKVEPPQGGDDFRTWAEDAFMAINAGKRSMTLDLKAEDGREALRRLIARADVVVENFRPGVAARLGLDPEALRREHPRLVYCSITGFGQDGPLRDAPAIEWAVQAASGMTATYLDESDDPLRAGLPVVDAFSGFTAVSAILAALLWRERTGEGAMLDVAMLDAALALLGAPAASATNGARPRGLARPGSGRYRARDRLLYVGTVHDKWFARLCELLGAPELAADSRFATAAARFEHREELRGELESRLSERDAADWQRELNEAGIPASVVQTLAEAVHSPHVAHRRLLREVDSPRGRIATLGSPFALPGADQALPYGVPRLGEHTDEILASLGYDEDAIATLRANSIA
jgi:crotonobetainyl-CoA:carnitine CoA-transferase CaiB-like acyl-CoA transferase